jgi:hypothetical protein
LLAQIDDRERPHGFFRQHVLKRLKGIAGTHSAPNAQERERRGRAGTATTFRPLTVS